MKIFGIVVLCFCIEVIWSHGLHVRQMPGPGSGGTMSLPQNYNYSESSKLVESDPVITAWVKSTGMHSVYKAYTNVKKIQYSSKYVYISCSTIPSYSIGPWFANPNTPSDQNYTFQFPRVPVPNTGVKTSVSLGNIGAWSNGVGMYNADDGMSIMGWKRNAFFFESISFDSCAGHPQQSGAYHHHVIPVCLFNSVDSSKHSPIVGFAFDGYPVYGPFAYSNASDPNSSIKRMLSSYRVRNILTRTTLVNGTSVTGPAINSSYPLGAFLDDFEYVSGLGDLDEYSGRFAITPEYPSGTYAYFLSSNSNGTSTYPYTLGLKYYGIVIQSNMMTGKVSPTEQVTVYYTANSNTIKFSIISYICSILIIKFII